MNLVEFGRTAALVALLTTAAPLAVAAQTPSPPAQRQAQPTTRVFLNGAAIDDIRAVTLIDMKVTIDAAGNLYLDNAAYRVERRPGIPAQIVRLPSVTTPTPTVVGPPTAERVFVVTELEGTGRPTFTVKMYVGNTLVQTLDGSRQRETLDASRYFHRGPNTVRFEVSPIHQPGANPDVAFKVSIGIGSATGQVLALDRVLARYHRSGRVQGQVVQQRIVTLDR